MTHEPDTEILDLQWRLRDHLSDRGFEQHEHYVNVEGDMSNAELTLSLLIPWGGLIEAAVRHFAAENGFPFVMHDEAGNAIYLRRRAEVD